MDIELAVYSVLQKTYKIQTGIMAAIIPAFMGQQLGKL